ncbi:monovalent cation/H+ antiporter subunit A [Sphingomonas sp. PP-CE-1G-424]|uniref:monovalent cation/H+ antiporter subunit A n=1 Tax=Sphingomonas sp. PP-CE-1G-424 TaxID=2135658 RepID=UPI001054BE1F|nr:monovalent cation/H+ antiporter subunit A [Sphingomonas sp. PP-CE-1G-424]TCP67671.1 multisubunit potassium/proton antiporter PhaA subunit /multisubunit potassium/proton antiporter PhaB subunit [Sphingomonas sp. PP-CE-1G-424]
MVLTTLVLLPFVAAMILSLYARAGRVAQMVIAGGASAVGLGLLLVAAPTVLAGTPLSAQLTWVPALGLHASLWLDPLGLLFAGLILGIGLLVVVYAHGYLAKGEATGRFLSFLMLFQGAMIGIALSANVLLLLVFWELTSLSSFLLIGFWRDRPEARQGARMALAVTGGGGLALIAGMLLLGRAAGSYELATILARADIVQASPLYPAILILTLLGAFTKSAQFPFHFWLPHAMAAPTPVSAYLHSATMVKAGVFLLARLWPVLSSTDLWFYLVASTGLVTMLFGAAVALFRNDLKAILAYSTISQLGLMVMLLGFGTPAAATAAVFHILNHAAFKAALFMNVGIVDHETGTRDIRRLGGLAALMPITATLGTLAAASMAGLPPLGGFISKEMMFDQSTHAVLAGQSWLVPILTTLAAVLSVAYALRYAIGLLFGRTHVGEAGTRHDPGIAMLAPSVVLVVIAIALGLIPMTIAGPLVAAATGSVVGGRSPDLHLALWHGLNPAFGLSAVAVGAGALVLWRRAPVADWLATRSAPDAKRMFDAAMRSAFDRTRRVSGVVHAAALQRYLFVLFAVAIVFATGATLTSGGVYTGSRPRIPASAVAIVAWLGLIVATAAVVIVQRHRYLALLFLGVVGLVIALAFVHLSAPDLALTQIAVEVVTILLMLLALNMLPKSPPTLSSIPRRARDALLGGVAGVGTGWLAWAVMTRPAVAAVSAFHWANSYAGTGGRNVVNVTLVDFRAFDTLGEIIVLGIAGLAIYALLEPAVRVRIPRSNMPHSPDRHPMMLATAARALLPLALLVGLHIFLRGHNAPGGGFVAALVFSIAIFMQYLASGFGSTSERRRDYDHALIAVGILIATATGLGSLVFDAPFLSSSFGYVHLPLIGEVEMATATLFDAGVASVVVGAVMMILAQLGHLTQRVARIGAVSDEQAVP